MNAHHPGFFMVPEEGIRRIAASFEEPCVTRAAILAYVTMLRKANLRGSNRFEDRLASMAQDMALPYREAQRAIGYLESIGLVAVERRTMEGTQAKLPSIYTVHTLLPDAITSQQRDGTFCQTGAQGKSPHLSQELPQELPQKHSQGDRLTRNNRKEATQGFDEFWKAFPRKVGKKDALKAWGASKELPPVADILAAIERQKTSEQWRDPRFIPHPATWIRGARWTDELPTESKPTSILPRL